MAVPDTPESSRPQRGRWQASLSGLFVLVLVAAVAAAVTRGARRGVGTAERPRGHRAGNRHSQGPRRFQSSEWQGWCSRSPPFS